MKIINIKNFKTFNEYDKVVALGFFDGFHKGHMDVISKMLELAKKEGKESMILTFNMSYYNYTTKDYRELMSQSEKIKLASSMGVDNICFIELSDDFLGISKEEFYKMFLEKQYALVCGSDYRFGKAGSGNVSYIKENFKNIYEIDIREYNGTKVGTTFIKDLLLDGNIEVANDLLGREYFLEGTIYKAKGKINISAPDYIIPKNGRYKMIISFNNNVINIESRIKANKDSISFIIKDYTLQDLDSKEYCLVKFLRECSNLS